MEDNICPYLNEDLLIWKGRERDFGNTMNYLTDRERNEYVATRQFRIPNPHGLTSGWASSTCANSTA